MCVCVYVYVGESLTDIMLFRITMFRTAVFPFIFM